MSDDDRVVGNGEAAWLLEVSEYLRRCGPEEGLPAEAWGRLHAARSELLRRGAAAHRLQVADADDVMQQVWLEVGKRLPQFLSRVEQGLFEAWLKKVLWSKVVDLHRRRARHRAQALANVVGTEREPAAREEGPAEQSDRDEQSRRVREVAERLVRKGDRNVRLFVLLYVRGWERAEVAAALDLTPAQARDRLRRGTKKIQAALGIDPRPGRKRPRHGSARGRGRE